MIGQSQVTNNHCWNGGSGKHQIDYLLNYFWMYRVNQQASTTVIRPVTPSTLRQVWSVIEETYASLLVKLSDTELLQQLLIQLADKKQLDVEEVCDVRAYIYSRIALIRDDAWARLE